jgi:hypothetical protein
MMHGAKHEHKRARWILHAILQTGDSKQSEVFHNFRLTKENINSSQYSDI